MQRIIIAAGIALFFVAPVRADLTYRFDITTAFAASDPFANLLDPNGFVGDTGYLRIINDGPGAYNGLARIVANSALDGDLGFTLANVFIPAGGSVSIGLPFDSSTVGGFNSFNGSTAPSPLDTFRPGIILYMEGGISDGAKGGDIKIAMQDLDAATGMTLTDPNGLKTYSFVLQGGDPYGQYNGDAWELGLGQGHVTLAGVAAMPEPGSGLGFALMLTLLLALRCRLAKRASSR